MQIIINADDLGASTCVNENIFNLIARKRVTSATLLANGPALREAALRVKEFPDCSFGVHLNATEFTPLTSAVELLRLLPTGVFKRHNAHLRTLSPLVLQRLYEEFCKQVETVGSLGVPISHLDSHHHIHTLPQLLPVVKAVQRRFRLPKLRLTKNVYLPEQNASAAWKVGKFLLNKALRYAAVTTDAFTEFETFHLLAVRRRLPACRTIELMVHPGRAGNEAETALLNSDWLAALPTPALLIPYTSLGR